MQDNYIVYTLYTVERILDYKVSHPRESSGTRLLQVLYKLYGKKNHRICSDIDELINIKILININ